MTEFHYNPARFWEKVDKTGECWEWMAAKMDGGYGQFGVRHDGRKRPIGAHRVAFQEAYGPVDASMEVDHMCHNRLCVNPAHLRLTTPKQNGENRQGTSTNNASGIRGVSWAKRQKRWHAQVGHNGRKRHVGYFRTLEEAAAAVVAKRNELFTHNDADRMAS